MTAQLVSLGSWLAPVRRSGSALIGGTIWGTALLVGRPAPHETGWAVLLLMLAPLVLTPLALRLITPPPAALRVCGLWRLAGILQLPAALALGAAFLLPHGLPAAALALPWLATTGLLAVCGLTHIWKHHRDWQAELAVGAGLVYISIGSSWAVLDRWGARPLDFEPVIVLLTAIHFHYAGFALPILTGLAMRHFDGILPRLAGVGVVVAVPLVAVGITMTQAYGGPFLECLSALLMASSGALTGYLYFRLARQRVWPPLVRGLWALSSASLIAGMVLAAAYGMRFYISIPGLDVPWMRAWHGSANALGFGLAGLVGWTLAEHRLKSQGKKFPAGNEHDPACTTLAGDRS